eukprot:EG_transcript_11957
MARGLDRHRRDLPLARAGSALLRRLSRAKPLRPLMHNACTTSLLTGLLHEHAADPELVTHGLRVLWRMSDAGPYHGVVLKRLQVALYALQLKLCRPALCCSGLQQTGSPKSRGATRDR